MKPFLLVIIYQLLFVPLVIKRVSKTLPPSSIELIKAKEAFLFCKKNKLDTSICFLVNMNMHSGKNRFFVWDFSKNESTSSGLCCHGMGRNSTVTTPEYSNTKGSNCTSLGKYKIGKRAYSNWGIHVHYKLHGLEKTNSNAFVRKVVLHSYHKVAESEIYPNYLPMSWSLGCPVVSNDLMTSIDTLLQKKKRPVLLWIYN